MAHREVGAYDQSSHAQRGHQAGGELPGVELGQFRVERDRRYEIDARLPQQVEALLEGGQVLGLEIGAKHGGGVVAKSHDAGHSPCPARLFHKLGYQAAVAAMHAVEYAHCQHRVAFDAECGQLLVDPHRSRASPFAALAPAAAENLIYSPSTPLALRFAACLRYTLSSWPGFLSVFSRTMTLIHMG